MALIAEIRPTFTDDTGSIVTINDPEKAYIVYGVETLIFDIYNHRFTMTSNREGGTVSTTFLDTRTIPVQEVCPRADFLITEKYPTVTSYFSFYNKEILVRRFEPISQTTLPSRQTPAV